MTNVSLLGNVSTQLSHRNYTVCRGSLGIMGDQPAELGASLERSPKEFMAQKQVWEADGMGRAAGGGERPCPRCGCGSHRIQMFPSTLQPREVRALLCQACSALGASIQSKDP